MMPPEMTRLRIRLMRPLALAGGALAVAACALVGNEGAPLSTLEPAGPSAERIDDIFWLVFWIATVIFFLVMGALAVLLVRFRDKDGAKEPKQTHGSATLEVVWTVIPALILAAVAVPTVSAVFDLTGCEPESMRVEVVGHQWWFEFNYPGTDVSTANVMVIPAGEEVCAEMTSEDVLHNFWVPYLMGKRYLIPGQTTELRLEADEPGEYWGHCAEFCGLSHSLMRARVVALERGEYEAWLASQELAAPLPQEGTPAHDGYQVFLNRGCTQCHSVRFDDDSASNVLPPEVFNGPDLTHFASRHTFAGAALPEQGRTYEEALREWLADPPNVKPGSFMPNLALTDEEIDQLMTWLESLR